jgi:TolB-like protein/AraC-like DNA-binding protein/Tfp pilus assembly protein PilF
MENQPSMDDQFLNKIYQHIEDNLDNEHYSVVDLSRHAGLSRSMLHRKLIKLTGKSATFLITEKRLTRAKELLESDVATAAEIAYKVGFSSPSYFNKVFKHYFQVSPGDVRKGVLIFPPKAFSNQRSVARQGTQRKISRLNSLILIAFLAVVSAGTGMYYLFRKDKPVEKSIAILPFDDLSSDRNSQYLADGIVEDLLNRISRINGLKVISRTSSEMFRDKGNKSVTDIAEILDVTYILEGTVQREGNNIRISIQLIDAKKDDHILSNKYDRKLDEVFKIQSEISNQIASELSLVLTDQQKNALEQNKTKNLKALEYYQMGRFQSNKRWIEGYNKSIEYYEKAIAEDPEYGLAYAGLADTYHLMALQRWMDKKEGEDKAVELALKALELDPDLAEAHTVLASLYTYIDWNWEKSEKEFLQAIKLNPNYSTAYFYYSCLLCITGRPGKAREYINKAMELDPFSFVMRNYSGLFYYNQGQFKEALAENKLSQDLIKDHEWAVRLDFEIYYHLGMEQEALESFKLYGRLFKCYDPAIAERVFEKEGLDGLVRVWIKTWPKTLMEARMQVMLGEYEKALDILEKLCSDRNIDPVELTTGYDFRNLHDNPGYISIMKAMGLPHE